MAERLQLLFRTGTVVALLSIVVLAAFGSTTVEAQSAVFNGAVLTRGSGFSFNDGVAVDASGNIYVADTNNNAVKKILAAGGYNTVTTLGAISGPVGIAVDASGNVFVAGAGVREILVSNGSIITLGSGISSAAGVAVDLSGNVYVTDFDNGLLKEILASDSSVITLASGLANPAGVAVDASGNVFFSENGTNLVKEILASDSSVITLAGGFNGPNAVALDGSGNLYVADTNNNAIKEILAAGGYNTVLTLGSGFNNPIGVAVDANGNVFVADSFNQLVKEIVSSGGDFGSIPIGTPGPNPITMVFTFTVGGNLGSLPAVLTQGASGVDFGDNGTGSCTTNDISHTYSVGETCTVDVNFTPLLSGARQGAVVLMDGSGNSMATGYLQGTGLGPQVAFLPAAQTTAFTGLNSVQGLTVDAHGNIYIADTSNARVLKETLSAGSYSQTTVGSGFITPTSVAVDGAGNLYVVDPNTRNLYLETPSAGGYVQTVIDGAFDFPIGVAVDGSGNVYVADSDAAIVYKETLTGGAYTRTTVSSDLVRPNGVAVDANGNVYIADTNDNTIYKETLAAGSYTQTPLFTAGLSNPTDVVVDGNGNVYVVDIGNQRVLIETLSGGSYTETVVAATGLTFPFGAAVDGNGNIYIADTNNNRVVKMDYADAPSLSFATTASGSTSSDSPRTVTLKNIGNADLTFTVPLSGLNPSISTGFTLNSSGGSACSVLNSLSLSAMLPASSSCLLPVSFVPTASGPFTGALLLTDNNLNAAGPAFATQSISLSGTGLPGAPSITFTVANHAYGDSPFTVGASSLSTGAFTYSVVSGPATISGTTVTITGIGTVVLHASQAADSSYTSGSQNASFTVSAAVPAITFTVGNHTFGNAPFAVSASSASSGAFTYAVVSGPATISGATVTLTGAGTVVLSASQAANGNYAVGSQNASFTVATAVPAITFTVNNHIFGNAPFAVLASSASSGAFTYAVVSGPATISGATVTLTGAGAVVLSASQAANGNYAVGSQNASFTVATAVPTITFTVSNHIFGDAAFTVSASSASSDAFTYAVVSGPATISGATVTLTGAGTVVLSASQAANGNYAAGSQNASFTVATAVPTITFTVSNHIFGDAAFTVSASSASSGAFTYAVVSGPATISGATITLTGAGTVVLSASQAANGNYAVGSQNASFTVAATGVTVAPDPGASSATGTPGGTVSYGLSVSPGVGTTFPDAMTLSVTGLPAGSVATFSPAAISAGSPATAVTLTIQIASTSATRQAASAAPSVPLGMGFFLLPVVSLMLMRKRMRRIPATLSCLALATLSIVGMAGLTGCGGRAPAASQNYSIVVSATNTRTNVVSSTTLTLTVQ